MRKIKLMLILLLLSSCKIVAQKTLQEKASPHCVTEFDSLIQKTVYLEVDRMPEYVGGDSKFLKYIMSNFKYPLSQNEIQMSFNLEFVINDDGSLIGERIKNKKLEDITKSEKEALRILKGMPKWIPGKCRNDSVSVKMNIPLKF